MSMTERIIILGGGYSVREQNVRVLDLTDLAYTIGINDSGLLAETHAVVSMDRLWMESRFKALSLRQKPTWLRWQAYRKNLKDEQPWPDLCLFEGNHEAEGLTGEPGKLNGFNSGMCGINLAYQLRPQEIYLFGFDHCKGPDGQPYWYEPYPWTAKEGGTSQKRYVEWSKKYETADKQLADAGIAVYNVSPKSALTNFEKISYEEFLKCVRYPL